MHQSAGRDLRRKVISATVDYCLFFFFDLIVENDSEWVYEVGVESNMFPGFVFSPL